MFYRDPSRARQEPGPDGESVARKTKDQGLGRDTDTVMTDAEQSPRSLKPLEEGPLPQNTSKAVDLSLAKASLQPEPQTRRSERQQKKEARPEKENAYA